MKKTTASFEKIEDKDGIAIIITSNNTDFITYTSNTQTTPEIITGPINKLSGTETKISFNGSYFSAKEEQEWQAEVERIVNNNLKEFNTYKQKKEDLAAAEKQAVANINIMQEVNETVETWAKDYDHMGLVQDLAKNLPFFKEAALNGDILVYDDGIYVLNPDDKYKTGLHINHRLESQIWDFEAEKEAFLNK